MSLARDLSVSAVTAGFVTVLVGFASSAVIVFQAASAVGATPAQVSSWMLALGLGMGLAAALRDENQREPALVTFLVTASGVTLSGVGSAFWGLVAGVVTLLILRAGSRRG